MTDSSRDAEIIQDYRREGSLRAVATRHGCSHATVANVLKRAGVPRRPKGNSHVPKECPACERIYHGSRRYCSDLCRLAAREKRLSGVKKRNARIVAYRRNGSSYAQIAKELGIKNKSTIQRALRAAGATEPIDLVPDPHARYAQIVKMWKAGAKWEVIKATLGLKSMGPIVNALRHSKSPPSPPSGLQRG